MRRRWYFSFLASFIACKFDEVLRYETTYWKLLLIWFLPSWCRSAGDRLVALEEWAAWLQRENPGSESGSFLRLKQFYAIRAKSLLGRKTSWGERCLRSCCSLHVGCLTQVEVLQGRQGDPGELFDGVDLIAVEQQCFQVGEADVADVSNQLRPPVAPFVRETLLMMILAASQSSFSEISRKLASFSQLPPPTLKWALLSKA